MKVTLNRKNKAYHFEARNEENKIIHIDANPAIGGENKGVRPMELVLMGLAGCASIDLGLILKKQRQDLVDYYVETIGLRNDDDGKAFNSISLHFVVTGQIEEQKLIKAIELTLKKYCSVALSLNQEIKINYTYTIKSHE